MDQERLTLDEKPELPQDREGLLARKATLKKMIKQLEEEMPDLIGPVYGAAMNQKVEMIAEIREIDAKLQELDIAKSALSDALDNERRTK